MLNKKESKKLKFIMEMFDAIPDEYELTEDDKQFLQDRNELEQKADLEYLEGYVKFYDQLVEYGLDDKIMERLAYVIKWYLDFHEKEFFQTEFYKRFKNHQVVQQLIEEK